MMDGTLAKIKNNVYCFKCKKQAPIGFEPIKKDKKDKDVELFCGTCGNWIGTWIPMEYPYKVVE